jgi:hypothetical protein
MTGSASAALTGLMFVVITLVYGDERIRREPTGIATFSTPTVVHFVLALCISALLLTPWRTVTVPGVLLGIGSAYGIGHLIFVTVAARRLSTYTPDASDWVWYTILPVLAYALILTGSVLIFIKPVDAMFGFGAAVVGLLVIGIRNAWDVVTFLATGGNRT